MAQAKTLTAREMKQLLDSVAANAMAARNRCMLLITHLAMARCCEVAALTLGDVLEAAGAVRSEVRLAAQQTKGGHARTLYINSRLQREISRYIATLDTERVAQRDARLFTSKNGRDFNANTACQAMNAIYRRANIEGATSHTGRRTGITKLANQGVSVRLLASLVGHRSINTTMRYIDVNDEIKRSAIELL